MSATTSLHTLWTDDEIIEILTDCKAIDAHTDAIVDHVIATGTAIPMRPIGIWEQMRLDQRKLIRQALA